MTYNASSRKDIRAAEKASAGADLARTEYLRHIMSTEPGRAWIYDLLAGCAIGYEVPAFDPHRDYFTSGRRSVGLQIRGDLETHCPDQYVQMIKEHNVRLHVAAARERSRGSNPNGRDLGPVDADADDDLTGLDDELTFGEAR